MPQRPKGCTGNARICKHESARMKAQGRGGSIINTASVASIGGGAGPHAYSAAKAAVANVSRSIWAELAAHRIRVNAIAPGMIRTPLATGYREDAFDRLAREKQPWPEPDQPQHIADTALFLASDESRFVAGQVFVVDGGLTAQGPDLLGQPLPFDHTHALRQGSPHDGRGVIHVVSRKKSAVTEKGPYVTYNPFGLRQNHFFSPSLFPPASCEGFCCFRRTAGRWVLEGVGNWCWWVILWGRQSRTLLGTTLRSHPEGHPSRSGRTTQGLAPRILRLSPRSRSKHPERTLQRHPYDSDASTPPDDTGDPDDDHDEEHPPEATKCVLDAAEIGTQTVPNRVANPHRVGHEEHRAEQVTHEKRAECHAEGSRQGARQKACAAHEACGTNREKTVPPYPPLGSHDMPRFEHPTRVPFDSRSAIPTAEPIAEVVAGHGAGGGDEKYGKPLKPA